MNANEVIIVFRPLTQYPGIRTGGSERSQFKAGYNDTLNLLKKELANLRASNVVLQLDLEAGQFRKSDGLPYSDAEPESSAIVLSFNTPLATTPLMYPCDTYMYWQDNLRAIALSLENLRAVNRYGVTKRGEQYRGFQALPSPRGVMPPEAAARVLADFSSFDADYILTDRDGVEGAWREAAKNVHPDTGGDDDTMRKVNEARDVLRAYHGVGAVGL